MSRSPEHPIQHGFSEATCVRVLLPQPNVSTPKRDETRDGYNSVSATLVDRRGVPRPRRGETIAPGTKATSHRGQ
jgi:hypothetical protein